MHTFTCMGSRTHMATAGVINVIVFPLKMCLPYKPPRCFQEFMQGTHPLKPVGGQEKERIGRIRQMQRMIRAPNYISEADH